jgi:hypothetical protein
MKKLFMTTAVGVALSCLKTQGTALSATFYGPLPQDFGSGPINTFVTTDDVTGNLTSVGFTFNQAVLDLANLPTSSKTEKEVPLPTQAKSTAFDFTKVEWRPQGHIPPGIYTEPHLDFHFYTIPESVADQFDPATVGQSAFIAEGQQPPPPGFYPANYASFPQINPAFNNLIVAGEGNHWADRNAPELQGSPHGFNETFLYGYINGVMSFEEPMLTRQFLLSLQSSPTHTFSQNISQPNLYYETALYPTDFSASFEPIDGQYNVTLGGLTPRVATSVPEPSFSWETLAVASFFAGSLWKRQLKKTKI